jgi:hypothetical protein
LFGFAGGKRILGLAVALALGGAGLGRASEAVQQVKPDLAALARLRQVTLPPLPDYVRDPAAKLWTVDEIAAEFSKVTDRVPTINSASEEFVRPDHRWLVSFTAWFMRLQKALKLDFRDQVWDCDDFARCFVAFANVAALNAGETNGSVCAGWATVANSHAFGGVDGSRIGGHAIVVVGTSAGLFVIEPQSGEMAALREYPNRDGFADVNL